MADLPQIDYVGLLDHRQNLELIRDADVLLCCSRDESVSIVVMEAAMFSRPSIISDRVGAAEFLSEHSHFMFESGNAAALAARIAEAHARRGDLPAMGAAARRDFERNMTFDRFARDLMSVVAEETAGTRVDA
jgi:glycosyltransferase involved in cell wall biosynthesis